ncbi:protein neprosin-like [Curcuma longa]|uniref:protein neprosin-like n=1 Tax=Curcuma longa TaxID=136217 RepID=UPI003D9F3727
MKTMTTVKDAHLLLLLLRLLLLVFIFFSRDVLALATPSNHTRRAVTSLELARIQRHLEKINKAGVRSIESPDGDTIDCVPRHRQPAMDHPLLKDHKIQRAAERPNAVRNNSGGSAASRRAWQAWHHAGHCPRGTLPIRRSRVDDVLRAKSLFHFGKKPPPPPPLAPRAAAPDVVSGNGHEHAIAYTVDGGEFYGAKATINVWDPSVQVNSEFSLSQMWILSGSFDGSDLNSIEAGWQVSPELYGDSRPRLFTYWTNDAYQATGCYNLLCSGFVQTNSKIAIGASISPVSSFNGSQYDITILIWKDPKLGNWWMGLGDGALVGYWPAELFSHLSEHATMVEWGGEVVNVRPDGAHTATQMGSGSFAAAGFARASYFRDLEVVDTDNTLASVGAIATLAENTNCYDIRSFAAAGEEEENDDDDDAHVGWGTHFYYGGPGNGPRCP